MSKPRSLHPPALREEPHHGGLRTLLLSVPAPAADRGRWVVVHATRQPLSHAG